MDFSDQKIVKKPISLLEGDGFYFNRILSRDSSVGQSSRIYYQNVTEGVPFKWEKQPGTPKNPQQNEAIPPPTPPPAAQKVGRFRPPKEPSRSNLWRFLKRSKKGKENNKRDKRRGNNDAGGQMSEFEARFEYEDFDDSSRSFYSSSSTLSSSSSSLNGPTPSPLQQSRFETWRFKEILLVCVARRS